MQSGFDSDKAREYANWQESRQRRASGFGGSEGPVDFDFSELFQRQAPRGPARGRDLYTSLEIVMVVHGYPSLVLHARRCSPR